MGRYGVGKETTTLKFDLGPGKPERTGKILFDGLG
jgi:hypothetical protein